MFIIHKTISFQQDNDLFNISQWTLDFQGKHKQHGHFQTVKEVKDGVKCVSSAVL